jgi:peptide/nickel transport system ATP-binding protein
MPEATLSVQNLSVEYRARRGMVKAVRDTSLDLKHGEARALIGESGSGKTTLGLALVRLHVRAARITQGKILYRHNGAAFDVLALNNDQLRRFRWQECAMVFQGAQNALNPVLRVEDQILDTAHAHGSESDEEVRRRALELLRLVQLDPKRVLKAYPHQLSGGMRQRVLIALGLLLQPQVLILDEPTTALDILTQRAIIDVLRRLRGELQFSMLLISHDLSLAAELADRVATMYAGRIVEIGLVDDIFYRPRHPYTLGLLQSVPTISGDADTLASIGGSPPDLIDLPSGCKFHPRCPLATDICRQEDPPLTEVGRDHLSACYHWQKVTR